MKHFQEFSKLDVDLVIHFYTLLSLLIFSFSKRPYHLKTYFRTKDRPNSLISQHFSPRSAYIYRIYSSSKDERKSYLPFPSISSNQNPLSFPDPPIPNFYLLPQNSKIPLRKSPEKSQYPFSASNSKPRQKSTKKNI